MLDSEIIRFIAKVSFSVDGCWVWQAGKAGQGYGHFHLCGGRDIYAHVFAYLLWKGPISHGLEVDHLCRNRTCVNPDHLELVTHRQNLLRGETSTAAFAKRTHCKRGHPFDEANTFWLKRPNKENAVRRCRLCTSGSSPWRKMGHAALVTAPPGK